CDIYSGTKAEAEAIVRSSTLEWVVLRFGGVLSTELSALPVSSDAMLFESALPSDNRVHTVDLRDVASVVREVMKRRSAYWNAPGKYADPWGAIPPGRPGDPDSDTDWFVTDWMDTTRAQEALKFQHYSWPDMMAELSAKFWFTRYWGRLLAPVVREVMKRRSAYWNAPGKYADPWGAIRAKLGEPAPDQPYDRS
ncbi:MAG: hypothetical protein QOF47_2812, partial [Mycobacterium sp.]|nr:hypothetical protein [Mycobacterium sp.]